MQPLVHLRTLYDVQQLLKRFNIFVYVGKRIWDIELMALEVDNLYQAYVIDKDLYLQAKLVLKKEHRYEQKMAVERKKAHGKDK
ncbi:YqgQ family protein [Limosilactobacillus caecicola]|uniref:YqgQ family protein n=1 Tax=Limosilactobacillus caecicola TaxID=2941332 RepID=UPI00204176C8|nr:YqgQ family protein [Limosilactobacillus caecicola]